MITNPETDYNLESMETAESQRNSNLETPQKLVKANLTLKFARIGLAIISFTLNICIALLIQFMWDMHFMYLPAPIYIRSCKILLLFGLLIWLRNQTITIFDVNATKLVKFSKKYFWAFFSL